MRGASDHWSIGERIAFYRRRRGYTQEVLAGLVGRGTDWLAKIERGDRPPPRIDKLTELARTLRVPLGDLLGQPELFEEENELDDVPAVRDALMSPRRLSKLLFGSAAAGAPPRPTSVFVERSWDDYQAGKVGNVVAALPGLLQTAQALEDADGVSPAVREQCWAVSARTHHLVATTLAKIGESDLSWLAAERAMHAADVSENPLVLASASRSGTHALLANGRFGDALELAHTTAAWLQPRITQHDPAAISLLGMIYLRAAVAAARHQDRSTAAELLRLATDLGNELGEDANHWKTSFGPTNVVLHRISAALDLEDIQFVTANGDVPVDHMPAERGMSFRIDVARGYSLAGQDDDALSTLQVAERKSPQLVRNNPRVRDTLRDLLKRAPVSGGARSSELFKMAQRCRAVQ